MKCVMFALASFCTLAQRYPGAVATDADLTVARNNIRAKLSSNITSTAMSIPLTSSTSGIVPNMVVTIDQEILFICAVSGYNLTIGTGTACPSVSGRGYDGTTAAAHNIGPCSSTNNAGCVIGGVVAIQHNSMAAEIKAIEGALGPNLSLVPQPLILTTAYAFTPQAPGGSLVSGSNTITLTPVPRGVNGSDNAHYLYVSGGTGAAEACQITGGTAISGQPGGTVILNCVNGHSGAWTIQSATAGIQEAWNANGSNRYYIPAGQYQAYASITLNLASGKSVIFIGAGHSASGGGTIIANQGPNALFVIQGDSTPSTQIGFEAFSVAGTASSGGAINCTNCYGLVIRDFAQFTSGGVGLVCGNCTDASIQNSAFSGNASYGAQFSLVANVINVDHTQFFSNCFTATGSCAGLFVSGGFTMRITSSDFEGTGSPTTGRTGVPASASGVEIDSVYGISITGNYCERNVSACVRLTNTTRNFDLAGNRMEDGGIVIEAGATHGTVHSNMLTVNVTPILTITGAAAHSGGCQFTTSTAHNLAVESFVTVNGVGGASSCNGTALVSSVENGTTFTTSLPFSGAYTSGGSVRQTGGIFVTPGNDIFTANNEVEATGGTYMSGATPTPCSTSDWRCALFLYGIQLADGIGASITSASTITPTNRVHHITGTAAITTIVPPTSQAAGFSGIFCAIPDAAFTTTTAGNIALATNAIVNRQLCWSYDPAASKWFPSY